MREAALLAAALLACTLGMAWLALAMQAHWAQVRPDAPQRGVLRLRVLGILALIASLVLCVAADHASMAVLVWVMALAAAALVVAMVLAWRPHWLRGLAGVAR
ncbi:MAG: DUF3325 domain-containing protein [Acidovorax sp.]|uniref:DUF3325 domain-containing protein n=1 Tax=Acidovorax sp. TaxID=1872122 RepID=UPI0039E3CA3A